MDTVKKGSNFKMPNILFRVSFAFLCLGIGTQLTSKHPLPRIKMHVLCLPFIVSMYIFMIMILNISTYFKIKTDFSPDLKHRKNDYVVNVLFCIYIYFS